jgi:hypothetical protein
MGFFCGTTYASGLGIPSVIPAHAGIQAQANRATTSPER